MIAKKKAPGRPRSFDIDHALETAMLLFHAKGYDAVGVAELVGVLGIKPPSFYAAFGSKAGLLERALERYSGGEFNVFQRARRAGGSVIEVIERMLVIAADAYAGCDGKAGCLVLDGARGSEDPAAAAIAARARKASADALQAFIAGDYPNQATELSQSIMIALSGMSAAARDGATRAQLTEFATLVADGLRLRIAAA